MSIANEMSKHAFITQLIIQIRDKGKSDITKASFESSSSLLDWFFSSRGQHQDPSVKSSSSRFV